MTAFLRWASVIVLAVVVAGAVLAYPQLRSRLAPAPASPTAPALAADAPVTPPTATPLSVTATPAATRPALIIQPAPTTPAPATTQPATATAVGTPGLVATTSLLPAAAVAAPMIPVATLAATPQTIAQTTATPTPRQVTPTAQPTATLTPIVLAPPAQADQLVAGAEPDQSSTPILPTANRAGQLYAAPDSASAVVGSFAAGDPLDIVAWFTQGTWYLLADGRWVAADAVDNPPDPLPLVVPTATFTPSPTPTPTDTPLPTVPPQPIFTPSPTPTSLAEPVCACDQQTYSCVSIDFAHQGEAQACFEYCFRVRGFDVHNLDTNFNGRACENLPPAP